MKTISFATTQMNLINCVEYLSTIKGEHALFLMADTRARYQQINSILNNSAYSKVFEKIYRCPITNNRLIDFILYFVYLLRLHIISFFNSYDFVVTGNYKKYAARLLFSRQSNQNENCKLIVCDDGLATTEIAKSRIIEMQNKEPIIFWENRVLKYIHKRDESRLIPDSITFYTTYSFPVGDHDSIIKNKYKFIKTHLSSFNIDEESFNCKSILLGQPLYCKQYTTKDCYINKLVSYSKTVGERIVYYAHPEEKEDIWNELGLNDYYRYINNFLPFEIIAAILPQGCRVASFFSSVLMNLHLMNETLIPECITFNKEQLLDPSKFSALEECYQCFKEENVKFYEFD